MKYLKLFEAFESEILGATMKFLSKKGKEEFLDKLKKISKKIDFPMSQYSDEYFQYLPYERALQLNYNMISDDVCDASSIDVFGDSGTEGEFCKEGKIKRNWGRGKRIVTCPTCSGTGVKPKKQVDGKIKWIKFWFDKNGNYIETSIVDGKVRADSDSDMSIYEIGEPLSLNELKNLPTGVKVALQIRNSEKIIVTTTFRVDTSLFMIQNKYDGAKPYSGDWRQYGSMSWSIQSSSDFAAAYNLVPKENTEVKTDPFTWNAVFDTYYFKILLSDDLSERIKGAHFAIVLDFLNLSESVFKKVSKIKDERRKDKSGTIALMSDEEIRTMNIDRYLEEISKRIELDPELKKLHSSFMRVVGSRRVLANAIRGNNFSDISSFRNYLYKFVKYSDPKYVGIIDSSDLLSYRKSLTYIVKNSINENRIYGKRFVDCIEYAKKSKLTSEKLEFVTRLDKVFSDSYEKINSETITNFDEIEFLYEKILSIYGHVNNSPRYPNLKSVLYNLTNYPNQPSYFVNTILHCEIDVLNQELDEFINVLKMRGWLNK